jgi:GH15 family glucan-1,4-alpha-glucosidase
MPLLIEDYALLGDTQTAALVGFDGSVDWLCLPRFDSGACFAALLGSEENGRWRIAPEGAERATRRCYQDGTLILQTEWETPTGVVRVVDFMPPRGRHPDVVRIVEGVSGRVDMRMELVVRFDYGAIVPWVHRSGDGLVAVAGARRLILHTDVPVAGENLTTVAHFSVEAGASHPFVLTWFPSHEPPPRAIDPSHARADTEHWWGEWTDRCRYEGEWPEAVKRSLMVLKALTYGRRAGIVARRRRRCPRRSAASATGTTATAGSGTRRSRCSRC